MPTGHGYWASGIKFMAKFWNFSNPGHSHSRKVTSFFSILPHTFPIWAIHNSHSRKDKVTSFFSTYSSRWSIAAISSLIGHCNFLTKRKSLRLYILYCVPSKRYQKGKGKDHLCNECIYAINQEYSLKKLMVIIRICRIQKHKIYSTSEEIFLLQFYNSVFLLQCQQYFRVNI